MKVRFRDKKQARSDVHFCKIRLFQEVFIMARGILGSMFDFDRNGELDAFERGTEFAFLEEWERRNDPLAYESEEEFPGEYDWFD